MTTVHPDYDTNEARGQRRLVVLIVSATALWSSAALITLALWIERVAQ